MSWRPWRREPQRMDWTHRNAAEEGALDGLPQFTSVEEIVAHVLDRPAPAEFDWNAPTVPQGVPLLTRGAEERSRGAGWRGWL